MNRRRLIVIIPGSRPKTTRLLLFRRLIEMFNAYFGVTAETDEGWTQELRGVFLRTNSSATVLIFQWSGGITKRFSLNRAAAELASVLKATTHDEVVLFGKSLGGHVAELVARADADALRIRKVVYVATPHGPFRRTLPSSVAIINVYSTQDRYLRLANNCLYLGFGKLQLQEAINIELPGISHSGFNQNVGVHYAKTYMPLFDLYAQLGGE